MIAASNFKIILLLFFACNVFAVCPNHHACICDEKAAGLYLFCDAVNSTIIDFIESIGKLHIQSLSVTNASWKVSKL